jgi:hypothetical protein
LYRVICKGYRKRKSFVCIEKKYFNNASRKQLKKKAINLCCMATNILYLIAYLSIHNIPHYHIPY